VLTTGTTPLSWAFKKAIIHVDPAVGLVKFSEKNKVRGILNEKEAKRLFEEAAWSNEWAKLATRTAAETGCRISEVTALHIDAIGLDRLSVERSYSDEDGFKAPKNGTSRFTPITPELRKDLVEIAKKNPYRDGLVFPGLEPGVPLNRRKVLEEFRAALLSIGITLEEQTRRVLTVHSFRHSFLVAMGDHVGDKALARSSGHKQISQLHHYQDHEREADFQKVAAASAAVFGSPTEATTPGAEADHAE
jgi:integrase